MRKALLRLDKILITLLMCLVTLTLILQTVGRKLGFPFSWTNELACYAFVWLLFIGSSSAIEDDSHISISFLTQKLPFKARQILYYFRYVLIIAALLVLMKPAFSYAISGMAMKSSALLIPMLFVDISVAVSFLSALLRCVLKIIDGYREPKAEEAEKEA